MVFEKTQGMTTDEFLTFSGSQEERLELIEGEIFEMAAPSVVHQMIVISLAVFLRLLGRGRVLISPIDLVLDDKNTFQPDVLWIAPDGKCEILEKHVVGAPDLIVEILSPSTARNDKQKKFKAYQRDGVREYWIIDPVGLYLEHWLLVDGKFVLQDVYADGDVFTSTVLESFVNVNEFLKEK